jgi:hypothetical protein
VAGASFANHCFGDALQRRWLRSSDHDEKQQLNGDDPKQDALQLSPRGKPTGSSTKPSLPMDRWLRDCDGPGGGPPQVSRLVSLSHSAESSARAPRGELGRCAEC